MTWLQGGHTAAVPGFGLAATGEGVEEAPTAVPFVHRIIADPERERLGFGSGDRVDLRTLPPVERYRWLMRNEWPGESFDLTVLRGNAVRMLHVTPQTMPPTSDVWIANAGVIWMLIFAGIIAWIRPERAETRILALLLIAFNAGLNFAPWNWLTPWPALDFALAIFGAMLQFAGIAMLATYAMLFARPPSSLRRALAWSSYAACATAAGFAIWAYVGSYTMLADPATLTYAVDGLQGSPEGIAGVLSDLLPVACLIAAIAQTNGLDRQRIMWGAIPLAVMYLIGGAALKAALLLGIAPRWLLYVANVTLFVAPLGLTYSLLNRRLLDIGFAINRAAVFTGVSAMIVGIFVLVEWILGEWFSSASHTTNLAISAALALVLGLSVRAIHTRVDRVLDTVFFRKRHEDEQAIRMLAREAAYITDPEALVTRMVAVLEAHANAANVEVLLDDGAGHFGSVSENDPAIVRLQATRTPLDLSEVHSEISGEFAYPMLARGRLVGALVLGLKRSGEPYAPDESHAIAQLAHDAGAAFDVLLTRTQPVSTLDPQAIYDAVRAAIRDSLLERA